MLTRYYVCGTVYTNRYYTVLHKGETENFSLSKMKGSKLVPSCAIALPHETEKSLRNQLILTIQ